MGETARGGREREATTSGRREIERGSKETEELREREAGWQGDGERRWERNHLYPLRVEQVISIKVRKTKSC